jgi:hypothetical protein
MVCTRIAVGHIRATIGPCVVAQSQRRCRLANEVGSDSDQDSALSSRAFVHSRGLIEPNTTATLPQLFGNPLSSKSPVDLVAWHLAYYCVGIGTGLLKGSQDGTHAWHFGDSFNLGVWGRRGTGGGVPCWRLCGSLVCCRSGLRGSCLGSRRNCVESFGNSKPEVSESRPSTERALRARSAQGDNEFNGMAGTRTRTLFRTADFRTTIAFATAARRVCGPDCALTV